MISFATAAVHHRVMHPNTPSPTSSSPNASAYSVGGSSHAWTPSPKRRSSRQGLCSVRKKLIPSPTEKVLANYGIDNEAITLTPINKSNGSIDEDEHGGESERNSFEQKCTIEKEEEEEDAVEEEEEDDDDALPLKEAEKTSNSSDANTEVKDNMNLNVQCALMPFVNSGEVSISRVVNNVVRSLEEKKMENGSQSEISIIKSDSTKGIKDAEEEAAPLPDNSTRSCPRLRPGGKMTRAMEILKNSEKRSIDIGEHSPETERKKQKIGEILSSTSKVEVITNPVLPSFADVCDRYECFESTDIPDEMGVPWSGEKMEETSLHNVIRSNDVTSPDEVFMISDDLEEPYHMTGFPNPPGENRCWLNATLQALFALPLLDSFNGFDLQESSKLTKYLVATRVQWMRGAVGKSKAYQTVKLLKEELGILDETYPSERQQDVSEFLMILLNHLKSDFDKLIAVDEKKQESENIPKNQQDSPRSRKPSAFNRRQPLANISLLQNSHGSSPKARRQSLTHSVQDLLSPKVRRFSTPLDPSYKVHTPPLVHTDDNTVTYRNPVEEKFQLYLMEHYTCQGCRKHRQKKVDNLMLYVDLDVSASNDNEAPSSVDLQKAVEKILAPEERSLTCGSCKHNDHTMRTTFRRRPNVLTLQLNRYGMTNEGIFAKISTSVSIPEKLDLSPLISDGDDTLAEGTATYQPICIIAHAGGTMDCGHYTSFVRHEHQWFHYNDMHVAPVTSDEALTAAQTTAYLVFFVKST